MGESPRDRFVKWFDATLAEAQPGELLPTNRVLARQFGISEVTVWSVLKPYREKGLIEGRRGKGTFVAGQQPPGADATHSKPQSSAESLASEIYGAICEGELKRGEALPPIQYVSRQFRLAPATVIRAYRLLCRQGHVLKIGKTYWIGTFRSKLQKGIRRPVYWFLSSERDFTRLFRDDLLAQAYLKAQKELTTFGFAVLFERISELESRLKSWKRSKDAPHGIVVSHLKGKQIPSSLRLLNEFVLDLKRGRAVIPPIICDIESYDRGIEARTSAINVLSRDTISTVVGREVARYVVHSGYRRACFFLDTQTKLAYDASGHVFGFWPFLKLRSELKRLDRSFGFELVIRTPAPDTPTIQQYCDRVLMEVPRGTREGILGKYGREEDWSRIMSELTLTTDYSSAFGNAVGAGIWVFAADESAVRALSWCRTNGVRVPNDCAIIGLENNPEYFHLGITACHPDWDSMGYVMAHTIIGDIPLKRTTKGLMRTSAEILQRSTTR